MFSLTEGTVWSVIGHEWAVELLSRSLASGRLGHAYLLTGPAHIGKTTLAKELAQALNCRPADGATRPCGRCRNCRLAQADKHPDIQLVEPVQGHIRIDVLRAWQNTAALSPVEGQHRVFVLSRIDMATPAAANCLLKMLEEPPGCARFVLTADRIEAVLPTIVSRCQVLNLRPLPAAQVVHTLAERGVDLTRARLLGHLSQGRIGWALTAAADTQFVQQRERILDKVIELSTATYGERFVYAEQLSKKPEQVPQVLEIFASWWHDLLTLTAGSGVPICNIDRRTQLESWAARLSVATVVTMLRSIHRTAWLLENNVNLRLALEVLMLDMPLLAKSA